MAIYTPGPTVAAISGSSGGTTFSRNRGGAYFRNRAIPITSTTPEALAAKTRFTDASQDWQGLTTGQREAWQQFADANPVINALGKPIILSGAQAFIGIHARMAAASDPPITAPPIVPAPNPLASLSLFAGIATTNSIALTFTVSPLGANEELWIRAAVTSSVGILFVQNLLRLTGQSAAAQTTPFDATPQVQARLGTLVLGQTVHVQVSTYDNSTGLLSGPLRADVVAVTIAVTVLPATAGIVHPGTQQLTATSNDPLDTTFTWTTADALIATVDGTGLVTSVAIGVVNITATGDHSGASDFSVITVT